MIFFNALLVLVIFIASPFTRLCASDDFTNEQRLDECHAEFRQALDLALYHPERAQLQFRACALKLDALRQHIGTVNGQFYYTLGSTWYLAGDLAQAVLALRRAEQLLPGNVDVIANLAQARADRPDQLPDSFIPPWLTILGIPILPNWLLHVIFISSWLMFWLGRFKQVKSSNVLTSHFSLVALGIILLSGGTILARQIAHYYHSDGVVTSNQVIARKGDALLYQPAFTNPLTAGTEVRICEKRPGWIQVQLSNGSRCWLPELAVTRIDH